MSANKARKCKAPIASPHAALSRCLLVTLVLTLACAGAAKADTFSNGQFVTYTESDWGAGGDAASLLSGDYASVFGPTDVLLVGVEGIPGQYAMLFTSASAVLAYLPTSGAPGPLDSNLTNPPLSSAGVFGGDVVGLTLDVDFNAAGFLHGSSSTPFGDLLLTNFSGGLSGLNGLTVSQFLAILNTCLGNGSCPYSLADLDAITADLTASFGLGTVNDFENGFCPSGETTCPFADDHLALPSSTAAPEPSSLLLLAPALGGLACLRRRVFRS